MANAKFNAKSPAVKRIMQEIKEMQRDESSAFLAEALEDDIFEWHFVVRGPRDTEFEGGIYHGRVMLPAEYPFKPPSFMLLTPNGRFQPGAKICLSISSHHPEHWQPSWSIRTALTALVAFMPSPGHGALGSLDLPKEDRLQLAAKSRTDIPQFGSPARQAVINALHKRMLELEEQSEASSSSSAAAPGPPDAPAAAVAEEAPAQEAAATATATVQEAVKLAPPVQPSPSSVPLPPPAAPAPAPSPLAPVLSTSSASPATVSVTAPAAGSAAAAAASPPLHHQQQHPQQQVEPVAAQPPPAGDGYLTALAVALTVAIVAILVRKFLKGMGWQLAVALSNS